MTPSASPADRPPVDSRPPETTASPAPEADAPSADEPAGASRPTVCLYCGTDRTGPYCHECGQKYRDTPLTLRQLGTRAFRVISDVEGGLLYTLRVSLRNPGEVARRYVDGEIRRFVNPISYLLLTVTGLYLVLGLFESRYVEFILSEIYNPTFVPGSSEASTFDPENPFVKWLGASTEREYATALFDWQRQYLTLINSFNVLPITVGTWLFFRKQSTLAETAVLVIYVVAQTALFNVVVTSLSVSFNSMAVLISAGTLVSLGLHMWAATAFYERSAKTVVFALLGYVVGTVIAGLLGAAAAGILLTVW